MEDGQISRREFLKQFVILSMLAVGQASCTPVPVYGVQIVVTPTAAPVYGPEEVMVDPQVDRMTYLEENKPENDLYDSGDVPVSAQFIIYFTAAMQESSQGAVLLRPIDKEAIHFESEWVPGLTTLKIVPSAPLQYATRYILEVGEEAKNLQERSLQLTESARAEFSTVKP